MMKLNLTRVMKTSMKFFAYIAIAGVTLFSCNKVEKEAILENQEGEYTYTFTLGNADTRSTIGIEDGRRVINWESGDRLGVYCVGASNTSYNRYADIDLTKTPNEFKISSYMALVEDDMVYTYAPYANFNNLSNTDWHSPKKVPLNIPAAQSQKGTAFDADAMPKVSIPYAMPKAIAAQTDEPVGDIKLLNLGAIIDFKIYSDNSTYAAEKVQSVTLQSESSLAGDFVFDLTAVDYDTPSTLAISGYAETSVITTVTNPGTIGATKDAAYDVYMVVAPGTYSGNFIIKTNEATYTYPFTDKQFKRNVILNLGVKLRESAREQVVNYVTLDWTYPEAGSSASTSGLNSVVGVSTYGLGTYSDNNYPIKFDNTDDNIQVKTDVAIGAVSLSYKMTGGGNTSYFDIYESANGSDWSENPVERLTVSGTQNSTGTLTTTNAFNSTSRYVKINYVKGSNVGIGSISITKPSDTPIIVANDITNVPAAGVTGARTTYEALNFTDDVIVSGFTGCVSSAAIDNGAILYSIGPNYEATAQSGTIVLKSEATPTITKTVNVQQLKSTLAVSKEEVIIPVDDDEISFTVTSPEFGWTISADDDDHILYDASGDASADPVTITVTSDIEATDQLQTIATLTIVRKADDPQVKHVVIKKAANVGETALYTANFNANGEHRPASSTNSYGDNSYTVSGVTWNLSLADITTTGSPLEGEAHIIARNPKQQNTTATAQTDNVLTSSHTVKKVTFLSSPHNNTTLVVQYSTNGTTWTTVTPTKDNNVDSNVGYSFTLAGSGVTTDDFRLKFSWSSNNTTKSNRDSKLDNIIIYGQ